MTKQIVDRKVARQYKSASKPRLIALEPRMLFDGAAVATVVDASQDTQNALTNKAVPTIEDGSTSAAQTATAADTPIALDKNQIEAVPSLSGAIDGALALAQPVGDRKELIVVDGSLENLQSLLDNISRIAPDKTLLVLDPVNSEAEQLTSFLQEHSGQFDAIHVLSHGGPGWISLKDQVLSLDSLEQNAALWNSVKTGLTETGDLLLYGCNVTNDANGQTQINALATFTGADIAASTDLTGSDGNWVLETMSGSVETLSITAANWQGDLGAYDAAPVVEGVIVNEGWGPTHPLGTSYVVFTVKGNASAEVTLLLSSTTGAGLATIGTDTAAANTLQYWNGTAWTTNGIGTPTIQSNDELLVRLAITSDASNEGAETFTLTATYSSSVGGVTIGGSSTGTATIKDDGTGILYTGANPIGGLPVVTVQPTTSVVLSDDSYNLANDDRPLTSVTIASTVNEASPYAVFTVTGSPGMYVLLSLGIDTATPSSDYLPALQYFDGTDWQNYITDSWVQIPVSGSTMLVRVAIIDDSIIDNTERFRLDVAKGFKGNATGNSANATIRDDGTGTLYTSANPVGGVPVTITQPTAAVVLAADAVNLASDDRALTVTNVTVNEASPFAVFKITAASTSQYVRLSLESNSATVGVDTGSSLQYLLTGSTWQNYTTGSYVKVSSSTGLLVRVAITNDGFGDGAETFNLVANSPSGLNYRGVATIMDDGTGNLFSSTYTNKTITPEAVGSKGDLPATLDREFGINSVVVNEASPYVVFTVVGTTGMASVSDLLLTNGTASAGTRYINSIEYWDGTAWVAYTSGSVSLDASACLLVRTPIINNGSVDNNQTFTLSATNPSGVVAVGTAYIMDDATGTLFSTSISTLGVTAGSGGTRATANLDITTRPNDDRPVTVSDVTVNEGSGYVVFTVGAAEGQSLAFTLTSGTALATTNYVNSMQYWSGTAWVAYTSGTYILVPGDGDFTSGEVVNLLVRVALVNNNVFDNGKTFAINVLDTQSGKLGTATIKDDGTGAMFATSASVTGVTAANNPNLPVTAAVLDTATPVNGVVLADGLVPPSILIVQRASLLRDDDQPLTVSSPTVNEASPYVVFTVTGSAAGQYTKLALQSGTAGVLNYSAALEFFDGVAWRSYTTNSYVQIPAEGNTLLVRVPIINNKVYEDAKTFRLVATTPSTLNTASNFGVATIMDDGTGTLFTTGVGGAIGVTPGVGSNPSAPITDVTSTANDDRPVTIADVIVNEASPYVMFVLDGGYGQQVKLNLLATNNTAGASTGNATIGATDDGSNDVNNTLQYWNGSMWVNYVSGSLVTIPTSNDLLVRAALYYQRAYERPESIQLTVTDSADVLRGSGLATIMDDGTGVIYQGDLTPIDASALYASAVTVAEKQVALDAWRQTNFDKARYIISGFHGAFFKAEDGGYYVSGETASASGTDLTLPVLVTPANGYNYGGTIIDVTTASSPYTQYFLLTTDGLYAWGATGVGLDASYTSNSSFQKISTPIDFVAADVKSMTASNKGVMFLMRDGTVRSVTSNSIYPSGHPSSGDFTKVVDSAGVAITGVTDLEFYMDSAFAYSSAGTGKFYTWGAKTYLGDGSSVLLRETATEMANPLPSGVSVVQIGITSSTYYVLGSDGKVYVCGANARGEAGQNTQTPVITWTTMRDTAGTVGSSLTNVQFISAQNSSLYGAPSFVASINLLLTDGSILVCGSNDRNMLGIPGPGGAPPSSVVLVPTAPSNSSITGKPAFTVETGGHFSSVMLYGCTGVISATGHNPGGAFADGTTIDRSAYVETQFLGELAVVCIEPTIALNSVLVDDSGPINEPPVDPNDTNTVTEDATLTVAAGAGLLVGATDPENDPLTITSFTIAGISGTQTVGTPLVITGVGTLTIYADGSYSFTPVANYAGAIPVATYTVSDGKGGTNTSTLTLTMIPSNDPFTDASESVTTPEDTPKTGNLLTGTSSVDGPVTVSTFTIAGVVDGNGNPVVFTAGATAQTIPGVGTITIGANGDYTFTPAANYNGTVPTISYVLTDGSGTDVVSTLNITVDPVVDLTAANDSNTTPEDTPVNGTVVTNDGTTSGGTLTYAKATDPANGTVTVNPDGSYTYTPAANFSGTDTFTYTVTDAATGESLTRTVTITVDPGNDPFTDASESVTTPEDTPKTGNLLTGTSSVDGPVTVSTFTIAGVVDGSGNPLVFTAGATAQTIPGVGTITIGANGDYTFTPAANYNGTVPTISYVLTDGSGTDVVSTLNITVDPVVDLTAANDSNTTPEDTPVNGTVVTNDGTTSGGTLTYAKATDPANGTVTVNPDGSYTYTPAANFSGTDTFTYTVTDAATGESLTRTVTITVDPSNDPFTDASESVTTPEDTPKTGNLLTGTSSVDGPVTVSTFTIAGVVDGNGNPVVFTAGATAQTIPGVGTITIGANGDYTFTPAANYNGTVPTISYVLTDGSGTDVVSTLNITVDPGNDPFTDASESVTTPEDTPKTGNLLTGTSSVDGPVTVSTFTIAGVVDGNGNPVVFTAGATAQTIPGVGTITIGANGDYTFTPAANYNGTVPTISYVLTDGSGTDVVSTLNITVDPGNDPFTDASESVTTPEDTPKTGNLLTGTSSVDGPVTVSTFTIAGVVDGNGNPVVFTAGATAQTIPGVGTITIGANGDYTFTPAANYNGTVPTISYVLTDGSGTDVVSTLNITVDPGNDPFTDASESVTTPEDTPKTGNLLTGTSSVDGPVTVSTFTIAGVVDGNGNPVVFTAGATAQTIPGVGTITIGANGDYTFTPAANYNGTVPTISYVLTDGSGTDVVSTLNITVDPVVDLTAANDSNTTPEDTPVNGTVVTNDGTTSGGTLTYAKATDPANGTVTVNPDGSYTYTPATNFSGTDTFTYTVTDAATGESLTRTVTITVANMPVVSITATDPTAVEGTTNSTIVFTVAQSKPSNFDTSIIVTLNLGTVEAADITRITYIAADGITEVPVTLADLVAGLALTIPATPDGSAPWSPVFTITAAQDTIYEVSEALTMNLALGAGETDATLGTAVATGTIYDESVAAPSTNINAPGTANPTDTLADKPIVSIIATDPAAVEGTTNSTLVFTVSQTNLSTVDTTVLVKGTLGAISAADLTSISYTDAAGTVVTLSTPTEIASFFSTGVTVKIPAGSTDAPVITFTATDDTIFEQSESFSVAISAPVNATLGTDIATGTIYDEDSVAPTTKIDAPLGTNPTDKLADKPIVSITATDPAAVEGTTNSTLVFAITQSNPSNLATDIVVTLNLGEVEAADITRITYIAADGITEVPVTLADLVAGLALTIPATPDGSAPWSPVFTITAAQDTIYEVSEALTMNLALGAGETDATLGTAVAIGTIYDEDSIAPTTKIDAPLGTNPTNTLADKPIVSITATDPAAVEGTTNSTIVFTVAQSKPSNFDTSIIVTLNLGTVEAADITRITYIAADGITEVPVTLADLVAGLALTIPATPDGSAPWSPVFTITAAQDTIYEVSEALTMNLALGAGETDATLGTAVATGTIYDESVAAPSTNINAPGTANPTDTLADKPIVSIIATDPAAVEGTTNSTLVFTVSQTNLSTVDTTVLVKGTLGAISAADLTSISYTDAAGTVVTLSTPTEIASFFSTGVTVKIPAGSTDAPVITFTATDDTIFEQSESFSVAISAPVNATLGTDIATGTIYDEDSIAPTTKIDAPLGTNPTNTLADKPIVSITATDPAAVEGTTNSTLVFAITQSNPSNLATDIVVTLNLGEVEAADITRITYIAADGITEVPVTLADLVAGLALTIPATPDGSAPWSPVFTITAAQDTIYEVSEALTMNLALGAGETDATLGTAVAIGRIVDPFFDADERVTTPEDTPISGNVIDAGLSSPDRIITLTSFQIAGDSTTYTAGQSATIAGVGTITIAAKGDYTFTPAANYNGTVPTVTYQLTDFIVGDSSELIITVTPVNDPPAAVDDNYKVLKGGTVTLKPLERDSHPDRVALSVVSINGITLTPGTAQVIQVTEGTVNVSAAGEITFTPNASFIGIATIPYVISDGQGGTATANEIITVKDNSPNVRNIGQSQFIAKPYEHPPIKMGHYEFHTVVLDFNGVHGGINQFSLPHGETTGNRGALQYSNHTPYVEFDRVGDEVQNARRTISSDIILSSTSDSGLRNPVMPPDAKLDDSGKATYILPPSTFVGGKGDIKLTAFTKDGKPLPDWIKFNPANGKFEISMPQDANEPLEIQIIATDAKGDQAKTKLNIKPPVKPILNTAFIGKASLASQIKSAVMLGRG
jgi:hypothetical protein